MNMPNVIGPILKFKRFFGIISSRFRFKEFVRIPASLVETIFVECEQTKPINIDFSIKIFKEWNVLILLII